MKGVITVPEWFFDKLNDKAKNIRLLLDGEYDEEGYLDHTKLRVCWVERETEKAYLAVLDAESFGGSPATFTAWIPKSVIS